MTHTLISIFLWVTPMLLVGAMIGFVFSVMMLFRNQWVYRVRSELMERNMNAYEKLPSYNAMMNRFWRWRLEDFQ